MVSGKSVILLFVLLALAAFSAYAQEESPADTTATGEDQAATLVDPALGACLFSAECTSCHGADGDGKGPSAAFLRPLPADFTDSTWIHGSGIDQVVKVIRDGVKGTAMAGFANVLTDDEIRSLGLYLIQLSEPAEQVLEED
jgi:mono/diheme cytochrome c family protein